MTACFETVFNISFITYFAKTSFLPDLFDYMRVYSKTNRQTKGNNQLTENS